MGELENEVGSMGGPIRDVPATVAVPLPMWRERSGSVALQGMSLWVGLAQGFWAASAGVAIIWSPSHE